jgi:hypothetical protein
MGREGRAGPHGPPGEQSVDLKVHKEELNPKTCIHVNAVI